MNTLVPARFCVVVDRAMICLVTPTGVWTVAVCKGWNQLLSINRLAGQRLTRRQL